MKAGSNYQDKPILNVYILKTAINMWRKNSELKGEIDKPTIVGDSTSPSQLMELDRKQASVCKNSTSPPPIIRSNWHLYQQNSHSTTGESHSFQVSTSQVKIEYTLGHKANFTKFLKNWNYKEYFLWS